MNQVSVSIDGRRYFVDSELAMRANAFRLPDNRVMTIRVWSFGHPGKQNYVEQSSAQELWANLPTLKVDDGSQTTPRYLVNHRGRRYEALQTPWMFSRTPDTDMALYVLWRDAVDDEKNVYVPSEVSELYYHEQLFELLPLAVAA